MSLQTLIIPSSCRRAGNCHSACLQGRRRDFELTWTLLLPEIVVPENRVREVSRDEAESANHSVRTVQ
jgi:hypothetical protein